VVAFGIIYLQGTVIKSLLMMPLSILIPLFSLLRQKPRWLLGGTFGEV
jgi:hypothetical protein